MLTVEWKRAATLDLIEIVDYISQDYPVAADNIYNLITNTAERLIEMPYTGRIGRVAGTREKIAHPNYIIVYQVHKDKIEIVNILHARQEYPR